MDICKEVKRIVELNETVLRKVYNTFENILKEIEKSDLAVNNITTFGSNLKANIGRYTIDIHISIVLDQLRNTEDKKIELEDIDTKINNVLNELIIKQLTL
ncbi:hypothetical protein ACIR03_02630 [Clostridium cochlearium]|uniref:hypothetical protein n=1 Tax=Clostridium cochlearium TaxID=1494 RepID=UPI00157009E8|nr:hypothetical protein [Clostridium cochlearium]MBV1816875.1 hypothetical protein [Bacteroidales bacterium MSK.15.36]MCG4571760.1 hypothetical protein [Clostridium cochlearium]MCG4579089.1 hypothetical protein [Clostridium cochlearium]NSJ90153.1 hypothetical protein [Coprococcus sp. MSK.21.13]